MRIKPHILDIPKNNPFKNDLLNREEPAEILTSIIAAIEGPCVLTIDAEWGMGKTTFLNMWSQYIRNKNFPIIEFNAWETDFSNDPLLTISTEIVTGLQKYVDDSKLQHLIRLSENVLKQALPTGIKVLSTALSGGVLNLELPNTRRELSSYDRAKSSITYLKNSLQEIANNMSETTDFPLVILIDELDRCRPLYAVELLETIKHLFGLDNIVFALAINRSQLSQSIKVLYGSNFDSQEYLRRFFDIDFYLPTPDRTNFIDSLLSSAGFGDYMRDTQDTEARQQQHEILMLLRSMLNISDISLRDIEQAIYRLGVLLDSLRDYRRSFLIGLITALIVRTFTPDIYRQFLNGDVEDVEVIDALFNAQSRKLMTYYLSDENLFYASSLLQAVLILATISRTTQGRNPSSHEKHVSRLFDRYESLISENNTQGYREIGAQSISNHEYEIARQAINIVQENMASAGRSASNIIDYGFWISIKRLELISQS